MRTVSKFWGIIYIIKWVNSSVRQAVRPNPSVPQPLVWKYQDNPSEMRWTLKANSKPDLKISNLRGISLSTWICLQLHQNYSPCSVHIPPRVNFYNATTTSSHPVKISILSRRSLPRNRERNNNLNTIRSSSSWKINSAIWAFKIALSPLWIMRRLIPWRSRRLARTFCMRPRVITLGPDRCPLGFSS